MSVDCWKHPQSPCLASLDTQSLQISCDCFVLYFPLVANRSFLCLYFYLVLTILKIHQSRCKVQISYFCQRLQRFEVSLKVHISLAPSLTNSTSFKLPSFRYLVFLSSNHLLSLLRNCFLFRQL